MTIDIDLINQRISVSDKKVFQIFETPLITNNDLETYRETENGKMAYLVAITPRSGSSFFCDLLEKTGFLGRPNEWLNPNLMPSMLSTRPATNVVQHLTNMRKFTSSPNGVFSIKASFFQFVPMIDSGLDQLIFDHFKIIKLFRKNLLQQAISLYIATETDVFHTNITHDQEKLSKVETFEYDDDKLKEWIKHIYRQELGWSRYLGAKQHLTIYYEDLIADLDGYIQKVSAYLGVPLEKQINPDESVFKKLGFDRSESIYHQFLSKEANIEFLNSLKIHPERYQLNV